jgi:N-acyl-L-homoserine lactone synthetase
MDPEATRQAVKDQADSRIGFSDTVAQLLSSVDYRLALSTEQREAIFRLRYRAYRRAGMIPANGTETVCDLYDDTDNAYILGLYIDDQLASSIRIHVASKAYRDFPSLEVFPDILEPELDAGKVIVDTTHFVADERLSRRNRGLPYATLRAGWLAAGYFRADHFLAAVTRKHQAFFRRTFCHRLICGSRPAPGLATSISLMTTCCATVADPVQRRFPFFRSTFFERRNLFECSGANARQRQPIDAPLIPV